MAEAAASISSRKDFKETPSGQHRYWTDELNASARMLRTFHKQGTKVVDKFLGGKGDGFKLNLFHSNTITLKSMLYGNVPKVRANRTNADPNDDVGRIAAIILERMLTNDIQDNGKEYDTVLRAALEDRLLPGMGVAKVRYEVDIVENNGVKTIGEEAAPAEYVHWRDIRWGWARTFAKIPWVAFRTYLRKEEVEKRWGKEVANKVEYRNQQTTEKEDDTLMDDDKGPWQVAEIWEIWDKTRREICWYEKGIGKILEKKSDFLSVSSFYPCPPFFLANCTTSLYIPKSDYFLAQDLYNEIDQLQTRISVITEAVKVVGVYDASAEEVARMFDEGIDNDLIPVEKWALLSEKGGLQGVIDWFPVKDVVETLVRLREVRDETIGLLQQVTGMSDIMRGELGGQYEGVGQSQLKAKFGSVRIQAMQDEFANFASDLCQLKAEVMCRHFEPEKIAKMANVATLAEEDRQYIMPAIQLLKRPQEARIRVEVKSESIAMVDFAQLKQERTEYLTALATFMQSANPMIEADPSTKPYLLKLLQWGLAGFKGSKDIEGVLDTAIDASIEQEKNAGDKPDPDQQKAQNAMQLEQLKHSNTMEQIQAKASADMQTRNADLQADLTKIAVDMKADIQQLITKAELAMQQEGVTSEINAQQEIAGVMAEIEKLGVATALKIQEIAAASEAKQREQNNAVDTASNNG